MKQKKQISILKLRENWDKKRKKFWDDLYGNHKDVGILYNPPPNKPRWKRVIIYSNETYKDEFGKVIYRESYSSGSGCYPISDSLSKHRSEV